MDALPARLIVDGSRCDGRGICALCCPDRITLDKWGYARVDSQPIEHASVLARARRAVAACPEGALTLARAEQRQPAAATSSGNGNGPSEHTSMSVASRHAPIGRVRASRWRISGRMVR